jgi:hypothetical protein
VAAAGTAPVQRTYTLGADGDLTVSAGVEIGELWCNDAATGAEKVRQTWTATAGTVSVTVTPGESGPTADVLVTVSNANPSCQIRIQIDGGNTVILPAGTTTVHVFIPPGSGRHSVTARTVDCPKGSKEHAKSKFVILDAKATGAATSPVGKNYRVEITGLPPNSTVTSTATRQGSPLVQLVDSDTVDRRGEATVKFKLKPAGTWVVTTQVNPAAVVNSVTVVVS